MDLSGTSTSVPEGGAGYRWNNGRSTYNAGIDDSDFHIIAFQVDHNALYAAARMFVDGTQSANTFTGASTNATATTQLNGSTLELLLGTGRLNGGGLAPNDYYDGQIAEFLVYNDQMSVEDINIIGDALSSKYNLPLRSVSIRAAADLCRSPMRFAWRWLPARRCSSQEVRGEQVQQNDLAALQRR